MTHYVHSKKNKTESRLLTGNNTRLKTMKFIFSKMMARENIFQKVR